MPKYPNMPKERRYFLACPKCKGETFTLSRKINREGWRSWRELEEYEVLNHGGFGWELERFDMKCSNCGHNEPEVWHEPIKTEVNQ